MSTLGREHPLAVLRRIDWWLVIVATLVALIGLVFIHSATRFDEDFAGQEYRHALYLSVSAGLGLVLVLIPYPRIMRSAWLLYGVAVVSLLLLPYLGVTVNGARRWYRLPGFYLQPSEFAKLAVIIALAAWLRFRSKGQVFGNLVAPILITALPALLVMRQPDLGSSLVFWPVLLGMSYAAGATRRQIILFSIAGLGLAVFAYFFVLHGYQQARIEAWWQHFGWRESDLQTLEVRQVIRGDGHQPWQSLIAVGSGGLSGFGLGEGPQNRFDFLTYRNADYIFSVLAEEKGLLGVMVLMGLQAMVVFLLLRLAYRTRERFGRILVVGVAAFLGGQSIIHIAVCTWMVPATGLPMPLVSYGGSSTMASVLALALALGVAARQQPVVAADGFA